MRHFLMLVTSRSPVKRYNYGFELSDCKNKLYYVNMTANLPAGRCIKTAMTESVSDMTVIKVR